MEDDNQVETSAAVEQSTDNLQTDTTAQDENQPSPDSRDNNLKPEVEDSQNLVCTTGANINISISTAAKVKSIHIDFLPEIDSADLLTAPITLQRLKFRSLVSGIIAIIIAIAVALVALSAIEQIRVDTGLGLSNVSHLDMSIDAMLLALRNQSYEVLAVFDQDEKQILTYTNENPYEVNVPMAQYRFLCQHGNLTLVHNHLEDEAFSLKDIKNAIMFEVKQTIVVSPKYKYTLSPIEGWCTTEQVTESYNRNFDNYSEKNDFATATDLTLRAVAYECHLRYSRELFMSSSE